MSNTTVTPEVREAAAKSFQQGVIASVAAINGHHEQIEAKNDKFDPNWCDSCGSDCGMCPH